MNLDNKDWRQIQRVCVWTMSRKATFAVNSHYLSMIEDDAIELYINIQ